MPKHQTIEVVVAKKKNTIKSQYVSTGKPVGQPSKYPAIDIKQVEALAGLGLTDVEIGIALGVCEKTLNVYKAKPEFLQALTSGKVKADLRVIQSLYKKAIDGDTISCIFWLKNRRPKQWRDKQDVEVSGSIGLYHDLSAEERQQRIAELEMKRLANVEVVAEQS
ncbi:hypothetical protein KKC67_03510 [Patescibacteria group bacterium]|nr:hypothetical protein [Patescibacteria group bacterium]MBU1992047.1 hypothetical protein [Patescibacteria group bacterium]